MSQASTPVPTSQGYSPPTVTQFSVFLENRVGKLFELFDRFDQEPACDICAFSVHESSDCAVVRLICNDSEIARRMLREIKLPFTETRLLIIELARKQTLSRLCLYLLGAELNIRFAYPLMLRPNGSPTIAMAVDDVTLAGQVLLRKEFRLLGECDLPKLGGAFGGGLAGID